MRRTLIALLCVAAWAPGWAKGQSAAPPVRNAQVRVEWLGTDACWFRHEREGGRSEYVRVDLATGARSSLFDVARLAAAIAEHTGAAADASALPIESMTVAGDRLVFLMSDRPEVLACDLGTYRLSVAAPTDLGALRLAVEPEVRRSRDGGGSSGLLVVNATQGPVSLVWIDGSGGKHPYAKIQPGASHRQHTYAGHAWSFEGPDGKTIGAVRAARDPRIVVLDGTAPPSLKAKPGDAPEDDDVDVATARAKPRDPAVSPDGSRAVIFREFNAGVRDTSTGAEVLVTTDGGAANAYGGPVLWSPDGSKAVVFERTKGEDRKVYYVESSPRDQLQPKLHSYDYPKPGDAIPQSKPRLLDAASGRLVPVSEELFQNPWSIDDIRWDADSSRFTLLYNQRGHQVMRVVAVDARSGEARAIIEETSPTFIDYSQKTFKHDVPTTGEIIWASERDGWNHLYLIDGRTGAVKNQITSGPWVVRGVDRVDDEHRQVWFRACGIVPGQDPYLVHFARVNFDGSGFTLLTAGDGTHAISYSPDRKFIVDQYSRVDMPPVTEVRRVADGSLVAELDRADASGLEASGRRMPTPFVAKGRDGRTDIYGMILWPKGFDQNRKYPVIESIYAGPHGAHVPKGFQQGYGPQELTDRGFIVVMIDGMGTNWRSKAFHDVCWKNIGDAGFPDRVAWIRAAAQRFPQMDLDNGGRGVGIYGGSAGGQNAMRALIDHHDFYKVAVADCGCHDNRMDKIWWNEAWMGWPVGPEYEASSNVAQAKKLEGKLLLMVGEMDENVDPASTMQVVDALVRADKDFDMLVIPGAGHGSAETPYGRRRRIDYFLKNLKGE